MSDTPKPLALARLEALLELHGADPARFPDAEREAVRSLIARDPQAARLFAEAQALDRALASVRAPVPSAALRRAVAEIPLRHPQPQAALWPFRPMWAFALAATFMFALGVTSGAFVGGFDATPEELTASAADSSDELEDDDLALVAELAFAAPLEEELAP
jgi:anti-sigma factor RsiW